MISGSRLKRCGCALVTLGLWVCLHVAAQAAPIPFAAFQDVAPPATGNPTFNYADNTTGGTISVINGGQVGFSWTAALIAANPSLAAMQPLGSQAATYTITNGATTQMINNVAGNVQQGFNNPVTVTFTRDTPFMGKTDLLTMTFENTSNVGGLEGTIGSTVASLRGDNGSPGQTVVFSSDFLSFAGSTENAFSWTLLLNSALAQDTPFAFDSFIANAVGQFSAMPLPFVPVPEPTSMIIMGVGLVSSLGIRWLRSTRKSPATHG